MKSLFFQYYLQGEDNTYKMDVRFNENKTRIVASRFHILTHKISAGEGEKEMLEDLRGIAEDSPLDVIVFNPLFVYFDQVNNNFLISISYIIWEFFFSSR